MTTQLSVDPAIAAHIAAINSFDIDAIMDTFADNALVNDASREFWGHGRIRTWITKEMVGDHVTVEPLEVVDNERLYAVRCKFEGDYDKTNPVRAVGLPYTPKIIVAVTAPLESVSTRVDPI